MQFTPKKSFENQSKKTSKITSYKSFETPAATGGRFIPNRSTSNLSQLFEKNDQENLSSKQPFDSSKFFSSILETQLFGDATNRQSFSRLFSYKLPSSIQTDCKENQAFSQMEIRCEGLSTTQRSLPKIPYKVLDAPQLQDDFYLNVLDWSNNDVLSVALNNSIYLWSAVTGSVVHMCEFTDDVVSSLNWAPSGDHLAVGLTSGKVLLYDVAKGSTVRNLPGHNGRVGALAWNNWLLSSGSRDKDILHRDLRCKSDFTAKLVGHKQEVCGLKWNFEGDQLASGGNDNKLVVWSSQAVSPVFKFKEHSAAVKAVAWSPHEHGVLVSGGGTTDRTIKTWNTLTGKLSHSVDTQSQVCALVFSKNYNELVSTHGYSQNQIMLWKAPCMQKIGVFSGHTSRVLYLAMSPDSQNIVTGAGDETLRFWNLFPQKEKGSEKQSNLFPSLMEMR
jgi:cell division cycle 20-like protein 1 (cofactor of APC complex)